jgi:hypothetical protein
MLIPIQALKFVGTTYAVEGLICKIHFPQYFKIILSMEKGENFPSVFNRP